MSRNLIIIGVAIAGWSAALAAPQVRTLSEDEVRRTIIGKAVTDGAHWRYQINKDGSIDAVEMGRDRKGRWHMEQHRLCIAIARGAAPDTCYDVMREGANLVFGVRGQIVFDVTIEPQSGVPH